MVGKCNLAAEGHVKCGTCKDVYATTLWECVGAYKAPGVGHTKRWLSCRLPSHADDQSLDQPLDQSLEQQFLETPGQQCFQ